MTKHFLATALTLVLMHPGLASAVDQHHHDTGSAAHLSLDHGRKWIADKHTVDSAAAMRSAIEKTPGKPAETSLEDLHATGRQLQEELQSLIRGCTMTGPAHEQLHAWISALAPEIQELMQSQNIESARASREKIMGLLHSFDAHFESTPPP